MRIVKPDAPIGEILDIVNFPKSTTFYSTTDTAEVDVDKAVNNWRRTTTFANDVPLKTFSQYLQEIMYGDTTISNSEGVVDETPRP